MKKIREIIIETPEKIRFSYHIAEIGTRIAAYIVDEIIQILIVVIIVVPLIVGGVFSYLAHWNENINNLTAAFLMIMIFLLRWFYFVFFEVIMEGQSPGKKAMRIRVIRDNGDSLDFETIVLRNFLRVVDGFPIIPLTGGFIGLIDAKSRRLGDIVANTVVVNEIQFNLTLPDFSVRLTRAQKDDLRYAYTNKRLSENELYIIRRFLNEYEKLPALKQLEIADNLAGQVRKRLGIEDDATNSLLFLERIYKQHGT